MRSASAIVLVAALFLLHTPFVQGASSEVSLDATASSVAPEPVMISPAEQAAGFVRLWSETKYNFAFFDKVPDVDWDKVLVEYLPRFDTPRTKREYYRLLQKCIAQLHDGHTRVTPSASAEDGRPAIFIRPIEGKAIVTRVADDAELAAQGIEAGCEILRVDGRDVKEILEKDIYPYVSASTPQMLAADSYWRILDGPPDSEASVVIRDARGTERAVALRRNDRTLYGLAGGGAPSGERSGVFQYRALEEGIAYVALRSFRTDECVRGFDKVLDEVRNSKGLIIDVRDNGGGSSDNGDAIVRRLIGKPVKAEAWRCPQHVSAFRAWGNGQKWYEGKPTVLEPATDMPPFLGPIVVLTSGTTYSAAEGFLIPLHYEHRATLVGEKTAGSTGQPLLVDLPGGGAALVCAKRNIYPDGREFVGIGVIPDVEVHPTVEDIAAGRDVVLERGIAVLKGASVDVDSSR